MKDSAKIKKTSNIRKFQLQSNQYLHVAYRARYYYYSFRIITIYFSFSFSLLTYLGRCLTPIEVSTNYTVDTYHHTLYY